MSQRSRSRLNKKSRSKSKERSSLRSSSSMIPPSLNKRSRSKSKELRSLQPSLRSRSKSRGKIKTVLKNRSKSRTKKEGSRERSSLQKKEGSRERSSLQHISPVCSMSVQFYSDLKEKLKYEYPDQRAIKYKINSKHIGQRKLLLTELYFLADYANLSNTIVYVGSAPGNHIHILADLFPNHTFILYDNRDFNIPKRLIDNHRIIIHKRYFVDSDVNDYRGRNILFVSDIRNMDATNEDNIITDMKLQSNWIKEMKPIKSLVKFRLPFGDQEYCKKRLQTSTICDYPYLNGKLLLQPWAPITSTEMRLIIDQNPLEKVYDCIDIEDKLFYHNMIQRNTPINFEGKKYSWDYMQECAIIRYFKIKYPKYAKINISIILNKQLYNKGT